MRPLPPAALAFDTVAPQFDARFGNWHSVASQRRAVRRALLKVWPAGAKVLELGGGTGEDALWMSQNGFDVFHTDASPAMVQMARAKMPGLEGQSAVMAAEDLAEFMRHHRATGGDRFDAAFSNFAALNCAEDMTAVARGLAAAIRPCGSAMLVLFGVLSPGEMLVEILRGRYDQALRRFNRGPVPARLGGRNFTVTYHRKTSLMAAMRPWFDLERCIGIGVCVPPSAAEPWISRHPRLLKVLESMDRLVERPLAMFGDHILYQFVRTNASAP
jgi:SAM-dependent methyltransferase